MESQNNANYKLSILDKRLRGFLQEYRQNLVLFGNDKEEVSYLLSNYLSQNKLKELSYVYTTTAFVDKPSFFKSVVYALLSEYTCRTESLDNLINYASEIAVLGSVVNFIKDVFKKEDVSFLDVLEVINKFITDSGRKCVLIIEEFLELEKLFPQFYQNFSKFIILQRNCLIVLTSSHQKDAEKVLSTELNLLFGNFEKVDLSENSLLDNYLYLRQILVPFSPSPLFLSFFINIIGSNVIYYDLISKTIKENYAAGNEGNSIISVMEKVLFPKEMYFFQKFIKKIDVIKDNFKDYIGALKILVSLSRGYIRKKEIISLKICDSKETVLNLQKLQDLNHIENMGNIYKIKDSLFSFWLICIFSPCFLQPVLDSQKREKIFRRKIEEEYLLFKEDFLKDKVKKVLELISLFKDDILRSGKDKYRLPFIEKIKIMSYPEKDCHFIIGEGKEILFVGVKEKDTGDADIFDFIERGSNIKGKGVRKIFISLDRVTPTAKLIAKSNRLILWDVNEVNNLLKVYNKPILSLDTAASSV